MHSALQMKEIVRMICEYTHTIDTPIAQPSLATLARVQKGIGIIALDVLWRDIPAHALLYPFPPEIVGVDEKGRRISLQPLCNNDWSRFNYYAPRIRALRRIPNLPWTEHIVNFDDLLDTLSLYRPCLHIIPNLEELEWWSQTGELLKLTIFMGPRIKHLRLTTVGSFYNPDRGVMPVLSALVDEHASLRTLRLKADLNAHLVPSYIETTLVDLLRQSLYLTKVTVQPSRAVMQALATLQSLKALTLVSVNKLDPADPADTCQISSTSPGTFFPALETLKVYDSSLQAVTSLIKGLQCFARRKIKIESDDACTAMGLSSFLEVATDTTHSCYLEEVIFNFGAENDLQYPTHDYRITLSDLRVFLSCPSLEVFAFTNEFPLAFDDDDLKQLVSAWPNIVRLNLGSYKGLRGVNRAGLESHITPLGLAHLSACQKLTVLSLSFAVPNRECIQSLHLSENSSSPLKGLSVGYSFLGSDCIVAVACFLVEHFPKLNYICSEQDLDGPPEIDIMEYTRWTEVNAGLWSLWSLRGMGRTVI